METPLERLKRLSAKLIEQLDEAKPESFDSYMTEREQIFEELKREGLSPAQRDDVNEILRMDKQITGAMQKLKAEAASELSKIKKGRQMRSTYDTDAYGGYQDESLFFDRRR
ncbi:flagellar biosynthesis/type III secretory pathway protein FliH [Paenibacillus phyllosphaerae]|uniref:Flagellar protein FliT n=1 Tax=Paenibacillus phyllosphaerae TaxID=274593 RepID=A0A7W5B4H4_9BACL|nr:flagellar protein FliT [Paenibacillus phyllosphaerae]MBB3114243.1 flagellar biosynthesis/type III secretory pathway protein FliH [Paenibacillus phyllosphaerae]